MTSVITDHPRRTRPIDEFPTGGWNEWRDHVADVHPAALYAAALAESIETAMTQERYTSNRELARAAGVSHSALSLLRRGLTYPDTGTIARLEVTLNRPLWPATMVMSMLSKASR